jgi:hypothetical protein
MKAFMRGNVLFLFPLLLGLASITLAHSNDEDAAMDMKDSGMSHSGASIHTTVNSTDTQPLSYFRNREHSGLILAHIVLMSVGWIIVLPLGLPASNYRLYTF